MDALFHMQIYQRRITRAFNKKVKPGKIKAGDIVLKQSRAIVFDPRGKFRPNWEGPYLVKTVLPKGAARISDLKEMSLQSQSTWNVSINTTCKK